MEYAEWPALPSLADQLVCTWLDLPRAVRQPVLPDACIDLVWDGTSVSVAGPDTRPYAVAGDRAFVGVRFRPGAAPRVLGVAASELLDCQLPLSDLWSRTANELNDRLHGRDAYSVMLELQGAILQRQATVRAVDPLVDGVIFELSRAEVSPTSVWRLAGSLAVSERTLRRRCTDALGYGPKTLDRILRFRRALRLLQGGRPLTDVAQVAGYADQSHLTNECRRLADATPAALAANKSLSISGNGCN